MRVQARELTRTLSGNTASLSSEKGNYTDALLTASFIYDRCFSIGFHCAWKIDGGLVKRPPVQHHVSRNADLAFVAQLRISTLHNYFQQHICHRSCASWLLPRESVKGFEGSLRLLLRTKYLRCTRHYCSVRSSEASDEEAEGAL
jgi:hypothetical protein